jgi:hypothetical protein
MIAVAALVGVLTFIGCAILIIHFDRRDQKPISRE